MNKSFAELSYKLITIQDRKDIHRSSIWKDGGMYFFLLVGKIL